MIKYWVFRYDEKQQGYVPAGGDYMIEKVEALRSVEGYTDMALYRYDHSGLVPSLIPSKRLPNGSFIDDLRPGRPIERDGHYQRITLEVADDVLSFIDSQGASRRAYFEQVVRQEMDK